MVTQKANAGNSKVHNNHKHINDLGMWQALTSPYDFAKMEENTHIGSLAPHILKQVLASGRHR